jgi:hypothetical protein
MQIITALYITSQLCLKSHFLLGAKLSIGFSQQFFCTKYVASAAVLLRSSLLLDVTRRTLVDGNQLQQPTLPNNPEQLRPQIFVLS